MFVAPSFDGQPQPRAHLPNNAAAVLPDVDTNMEICIAGLLSLQEKDFILDVLGRAGHPIINTQPEPDVQATF